jgi:hypothetical protein
MGLRHRARRECGMVKESWTWDEMGRNQLSTLVRRKADSYTMSSIMQCNADAQCSLGIS